MNAEDRGKLSAYPVPGDSESDGMTIREAFTMAAISGLNANPSIHSSVAVVVERRGESRPVSFLLGQMAVEVADAALRALEDKEEVGFEDGLKSVD